MRKKENVQKKTSTKNTIQINVITEKTKKSFMTRLVTSGMIFLIGVPSVALGNWFYAILVCLLAIIASWEFIRVLKSNKHPIWIDIFTFIMTITFIYWSMISNYLSGGEMFSPNGDFLLTTISISTIGFAVLICGLFLGCMLTSKFSVADACYYFTMSLFISISFQALYFIRFVPMSSISNNFDYNGLSFMSSGLLFYVVLGSFISDVGAYLVGILFGKHKMNPRISPNKTWEGFVGGVVISSILSIAFALILSFCGFPILKGVLDHEHWYWIVLVSLIMPVVSVIGDFIFSTIKRHYNIKDFSKALPGHGGILDRLDSILVTSLFVTLIIIAIHYFPFVQIG